jgi:hypothetical protein
VAKIGKLTAEPLLMRVEHPAQHQFAAGVDEFDPHDFSYGCLERPGFRISAVKVPAT